MSDKKVYAIVRGGLGNQLFIYAAARKLALANDASVVLLNDSYENEFHGRDFLLTRFGIAAEVAALSDPSVPYDPQAHRRCRKRDRFFHFIGRPQDAYFIERRKRLFKRASERVDPRFWKIDFDRYVFLDGYFQDESYFVDIADTLREELRSAAPLAPETAALADRVRAANAVCLHFRRTELEDVDVRARHDTELGYRPALDLSFYERAIERLGAREEGLEFFAFSDYPQWMLENVRLSVPVTLVTHNCTADTCHEDLYLMSQCRHHIISHSTFGWWGAWLSQRAGGRVLAPVDTCGRPKSPFYPASWETVDVCLREGVD